MDSWSIVSLREITLNFDHLSSPQKFHFLEYMNGHFPPSVYETHLDRRRNALSHISRSRNVLDGAEQAFPSYLVADDLQWSPSDLQGCGIVFTAGGEGERLRLSLMAQGTPAASLNDFTKATYPIQGFFKDFGALHINLSSVSRISSEYGIRIPVIITTGPPGSITARVIPEILDNYNNFGIRDIMVVAQDERLHLSMENKAVYRITDGMPYPITHPDETGGPLMKLKQKANTETGSALQWMAELGCEKIIVVQATALYDQRLLPLMAAAATNHDCLAVGLLNETYDDQFGSIVCVSKADRRQVMILEKEVKNETTRKLKDPSGRYFAPLNTGFYVFDISLLAHQSLPDYATPPKEIIAGVPRSPKVGYAATDLLPCASNPIILAITPDLYGVIKTADDLNSLAGLARRFGLDAICKKVATQYRKN